MAAKSIPIEQRITTPMITNVPLRLRKDIERLARKHRVPLGEIVRRAVASYVEQQGNLPRAEMKEATT